MLKRSAQLFSFLTLVTLLIVQSFAATFAVTKIGALDLGGKTYPEWWYTATNPTFQGTAEASKEVTVMVNSDTHKVTSDGNGNWSYSSALDKGDYDIKISQGSNSYAFKLHLGQGLPENLGGTQTSQSSQTTSSVPTTGYNQIAAIGFGLGLALLASYFYISGDVDRKVLFEKRIIKED